MGMDSGSLGKEQSARGASPLGIILKGKVPMNVVLVRPQPRQRAEGNTMLEVHTTDTNRLKEFRRRHSRNIRCKWGFGVFGEDGPCTSFQTIYVLGAVQRP